MTDQVAFVGLGANAVCWYRCVLPAMAMASDWLGVVGHPPEMRFVTGLVKGATVRPEWDDYKLVVVQQPRGRGWARWIQGARERGIKVVYEIDDYVHGIARMQDHDYRQHFDKKGLAEMELCMALSDAMICSTEYVARRYRKYNKHVYVCENGIDMSRYQLTRPTRRTVNVGWAGATGHQRSVLGWLEAVGHVMERHDDVCFISIGQAFADYFVPQFPKRALSVPFTLVDIYPAAMTMFDIALAPAGPGNFFRGKSDLRWLEAGNNTYSVVEVGEQNSTVLLASTLAVLSAAERAGVRRVVVASSSAVYGDRAALPKKEAHEPAPASPYAVAKLCSEIYARHWADHRGLQTVCLRFFNVFGPRQDPRSPYAAAIPIFLSNLLSDRPVPIFGDGKQTRDFTYVDDVIQGILSAGGALGASGRVYNIAAGRGTSVLEMVEALAQLVGVRAQLEMLPPRAGDLKHSRADISAAAKDLKYAPRTSLKQGLVRTVEWFREASSPKPKASRACPRSASP